ncbi:MAG: hypothetical protein ACI89X_005083 [Planctomycetota bacterium]|jgi:hypothetical protein
MSTGSPATPRLVTRRGWPRLQHEVADIQRSDRNRQRFAPNKPEPRIKGHEIAGTSGLDHEAKRPVRFRHGPDRPIVITLQPQLQTRTDNETFSWIDDSTNHHYVFGVGLHRLGRRLPRTLVDKIALGRSLSHFDTNAHRLHLLRYRRHDHRNLANKRAHEPGDAKPHEQYRNNHTPSHADSLGSPWRQRAASLARNTIRR